MQALASFGIHRVYSPDFISDPKLFEYWNIFIGYTGTPQSLVLEGRASGVKLFFRYSSSRQMATVSFPIYITRAHAENPLS